MGRAGWWPAGAVASRYSFPALLFWLALAGIVLHLTPVLLARLLIYCLILAGTAQSTLRPENRFRSAVVTPTLIA